MNRQRYLVTGAAGFLGRHFLAALAGRQVRTRAMLSRPRHLDLPGDPEIVVADLTRAHTLPAAVEGVTHVIHLAARTEVDAGQGTQPLATFRAVNVDGSVALAEAAIAAGVQRLLFVSSVKAMGEGTTGVCDETSRCRPRSAYGVSKLEAERALLRLADESDLQLTIVRLPLVYGPGCKGNVYRLLQAAAAGRSLPLGSVHNRRSMVYVGNVVAAGLTALTATSSSGKVYLVTDGRPYSTAELYGAMCEALGRPPALRAVPVSLLRLLGTLGGVGERLLRRPLPVNPRVVRRLTGDLVFRTDRIRRELGFRPPFDLKEGMAETVAWYRDIGAAGDVR